MLAQKLRELRNRQGYTQGELGALIGVSASTIGMYEQGRREPDSKNLAKLCQVLQVTTDELLLGNQPRGEDPFSTNELGDIITDLREKLMEQEGLMFNGVLLTEEGKQQIVDALEIGAQMALARSRKQEEAGEEQEVQRHEPQ